MYDLYLKGNRTRSERKNYSEIIGLLMACGKREKQESKNRD